MSEKLAAFEETEQKKLSGFGQWLREKNHGNRLVTLVFFLPPALLLFTLFVMLPLGEAGYYSFFKWNGYGEPSRFVDFNNYIRLFNHGPFEVAVWNTVKIILVSLVIQLPLALIVALSIYKQSWSNSVFRLIFFLPYILAEVVAGLIWRFVFDGDYGMMAGLAESFGLEPWYILADRDWAFTAILVVIVWKYFGFHMMIYIAALQSVPKDLIEASKLDGASKLQTIWNVKLPLIASGIKVSIFFSILGALQTFDLIMPLTGGGPSHTSHSLVTYLYTFGITRMNVGFGSAVGVVLFIACVVFAFTYQSTVMKENKD
ncbi:MULTISPECIES: carbohydrate ABC transporter permease [unclassified Vibrio]|uniref:carbohydrate ABC transporter permease n=1 Tax=unclassified Vibrio TaxID=2614977 RepID=UPI00159E4BDD|nr:MULTISPECIES: sugar ABC transporter permease [unclassified Vibrio]NVN80560.1 sugar ABC transporter permease [Vibrio sp. Scap16]QLE95625.1 sugar ABC transporter permease [Vibrio sp. Scap24]